MRKIKKQMLRFLIVLVLGVSIILTACKNTTSYTYSFNVDGGVSISDVSIEEGTDYTLPTTAEKEGYVFEGWYDNPEFSGDAITSVKASANLTFYAKWSKLYVATLDANGGSLSTTSVSLKVGANLKDALKDLNPTKSGVTFAGWFKDGKALAASDVMPAQDISLVAKYQQTYKVEYYQQKMDGSGYDKTEETGSAIIGETVTAEKDFAGFNEVNKSETIDSIVINEDASKNVLKKYYDRNLCNITLNSNYPTDKENVVTTKGYIAGSKIELTNDLTCDGYLLVGWSDAKDGEVLYQINPISSVYNDAAGSGLPASTEALVATETKTLYAIWKKGYTDMFGGKDSIYLFEDKIFLNRYDVFFKGEYFADDKSFSFVAKEDIILEGKFITDDTFAYRSDLRTNGAYTLVDVSGLNENVMLYFSDGYNGCRYSVKGEDGITAVSEGTYEASKENEDEYVITFDDGPLKGQKRFFFVGLLDGEPVFKIRNDAELELTGLGVYTIENGVPTLDENVKLTFDGYGSCTLGETEYLCSYDGEKSILTLYSTEGSLAGYLKVVEYNNKKGLADYVMELDHTYTSGADTLTLDGVCTATYKTGSEEIKGTYSFTNSFLSFAIVDFVTEANESYKFTLVHDVKVNEANPEESTVNYLFNKVEKEYGEYLYLDAESIYYAPLIVTENATQASLYGFTEEEEYVKVSSGTYSLDQVTNRYTYTATQTYDGSTAMDKPFDLTKVQSIVYQVDVVQSYLVNYWFEYKDSEGTTISFVKEYTWETEMYGQTVTFTLTLVADKAIIKSDVAGSEAIMGNYSKTGNNVLTIELSDDKMLVELDEENKTFTEIYETYTMYEYKNNEVNKNNYIFLDKTGKLLYFDDKTTENGIEGTIEETNETTKPGSPIWLFTSKDKTVSFNFIILSNNTDEYFARYDEALAGKYTGVDSSKGGILELDGYGFLAMAYIDGQVINGLYTIDTKNNVITFTDENDDLYFFDLKPNNTYTLRGYEYGSYFLLNNQAIDYLVKLDGYGKAELNKIIGEEEQLVDDKATYYFDEKDYFILTYTEDNKQITATCVLTTYILSGDEYPAIAVSHKEVVSKYVNEADWSILLVDEFGLATLYDSEGFMKEGSCSILSTNLLYFVTDDGSYAGIYQFDIETGSLSQTKLKLKSYYTYDFESLIFTDYGLVIDNGSANSYYNIENDKIIVYAYEPESEKANEYGYVQKEYGQYGDEQIVADEKTYYINTGYAIEFKRAESDKLADNSYKYPFVTDDNEKLLIESLYFSPTGKEFNVSGQIKIGGKDPQACTVVREKLADNTYNTYVVVEDQYYITINLTYAGIDETEESLSTFTVTAFKSILEIPSFDYVYISWYISQMFGQDAYGMFDNTYGGITLYWEYDEKGEVKSQYANTTFADTAALKDSKGNEINLKESKYKSSVDTSSGTIYVTASIVAEDGYTYNLYLESQVIEDYNHLGIAVVAMTRTQTLTAGDYKVEVEQLVYHDGTSDTTESDSLGDVYDIKITKGETAIPVELILTDDYGNTFAVSRTYDDAKKITSTVYYLLEYTLAAKEADSTYAPLYETFKVTETAVTTYYTADGSSYVDILADGKLEMISIDGEFVTYANPKYDEATKTYTYEVEGKYSYVTYSIVITEGVATIEYVKETPKAEVGTGE